MSSGIYLLLRGREEGEAAGYVGQTTNFNRRYSSEVRKALGAWVDVPKSELNQVEKEAIEFCRGFGLPLNNIQHNGRPIYRNRIYRHDPRYE